MDSNKKITTEKRCRHCGRIFSQPVAVSINNGNGGFIDHSFCPRCRSRISRRALACDPRYSGTGGHCALEVCP